MVPVRGTVQGRQGMARGNPSAEQRDRQKIQKIREETDLKDPVSVLRLYQRMKTGAYHFETAIGREFDDHIFELAEKYEAELSAKKTQKNKKNISRQKIRKKMGQKKKVSPISLHDFDGEMQKEIAWQLKLRERRRRLLILLCSMSAVLCFGYFISYYYLAERTDADYEQLAGLKNSDVLAKEEEVVLELKGKDVDLPPPELLDEYKTLYNKNKKLIGWLKIDDTIIDYPVMQTSNNEYYLDHNFSQEKDKNGSIFMDAACMAYPRSQNLILYGHHMKSGKMFGGLEKYASKSYYEKHSIIQFDTIYEKSTYQVMYVFRARVLKENEIAFKYYQFIDAGSVEEFESHMKEMAEMSLYDTGVTAGYGDELLTLSTCDNSQTDGRFVVVAKRIR